MTGQQDDIFKNLFVLEAANNHWGSVERGLKIVRDHAQVVKFNNVRAAIKLQFRDVDAFIHDDFKGTEEIRYVSKTEATKMSVEDFTTLVNEIKRLGCIPMATPFDEKSVDLCVHFEMPIIKVASSDVNDWPLLEKIASTRKPTIISSGGASEKDLDDVVRYFANRDIPLAVNHCVSLYPTEEHDLQLDQIDYLRKRYPDNVIGLSTHEYVDWSSSMMVSYAKGARTWERHIDIDYEGVPVSKYCSLPEQCDTWYKAFHKAAMICGGNSETRRPISNDEKVYLDALVRGVYARRDLPVGYEFDSRTFNDDFYLAIPLRKKQLSCREIINGEKLTKELKADQPLELDDMDANFPESMRELIINRGL